MYSLCSKALCLIFFFNKVNSIYHVTQNCYYYLHPINFSQLMWMWSLSLQQQCRVIYCGRVIFTATNECNLGTFEYINITNTPLDVLYLIPTNDTVDWFLQVLFPCICLSSKTHNNRIYNYCYWPVCFLYWSSSVMVYIKPSTFIVTGCCK